jgi:hypothetical protein
LKTCKASCRNLVEDCVRQTSSLTSSTSARKPVLASGLLAVVGPPCSGDERRATEQVEAAEKRGPEPTCGENGCSDRATDQDSECTEEHVEAESASDGAHVRRHGRNTRTLKGDKGACAESVKESPDDQSDGRTTNAGPAEGEDGRGTGAASENDERREKFVGDE